VYSFDQPKLNIPSFDHKTAFARRSSELGAGPSHSELLAFLKIPK